MTAAHLGAALAMMLALATPNQAFARHLDGGSAASIDADIPEGYLPGLSAATGLLCVKQCPADDAPCDPPVYKHADGRCTTQWR